MEAKELVKEQFHKHSNCLKTLIADISKSMHEVEEQRLKIVNRRSEEPSLPFESVEEDIKAIQNNSLMVSLKQQESTHHTALTLEYFNLAKALEVDLDLEDNEEKELNMLNDQMKSLFKVSEDGKHMEITDNNLFQEIMKRHSSQTFSAENLKNIFNSPAFTPKK